jgi:enamine deaminase RidA (YjgF/YER057c/UK114 family)
MERILLFILMLTRVCSFAQTDSSIVKFANPPDVSAPKGFSHVVKIDMGTSTMLIVSGQLPLDKTGRLVEKGNIESQTEQVFANIRACVEYEGGTMDHLVKLTIFVTDISQLQSLRKARDKFINTEKPPSSSLVQVSKLSHDDALVEVEGIAIIPKAK